MTAISVDFSKHAVQRWTQRGRISLDVDDAAADLGALRSFAEVRELHLSARRGPEPHLVLGDYLFPLVKGRQGLLAVTCVSTRRHEPKPASPQARRRPRTPRVRPYSRPRHIDWLEAHASGLLENGILN